MLSDKIKKFYKTRGDYFDKKREIAKAMFDLQSLLLQANEDLADTIDNGFDTALLVKVEKAYGKHKFNSKIVQDFLSSIDKMFLAGIDSHLKENLEVVKLQISVSMSDNSIRFSKDSSISTDFSIDVDGPILVSFIDTSSERSFTIEIPVKSAVTADMVNWETSLVGLYKVYASTKASRNDKDICHVFDSSKISLAVSRLLKGELDEELEQDTFLLKRTDEFIKYIAHDCDYYKNLSKQKKFYDPPYDQDSWRDDAEFVHTHDLFDHDRWNVTSQFKQLEYEIASCIDDRDDYLEKEKQLPAKSKAIA